MGSGADQPQIAETGAAWPPVGFTDRHGAAAILGVSTFAVRQFVLDGILPAGRPAARPNGRPAVLYAVADVVIRSIRRVSK